MTITIDKNESKLSLQPLPKIDEVYVKLKGAKYFTTLDLCSSYYHITLAPETRAKTAFVTPFGKYEFNQVPSTGLLPWADPKSNRKCTICHGIFR